MSKYFEYIGLISLMIFSFMLTEKTTTIAHNIDEIMVTINDNYKKYNIDGENATIDKNTIIPGICSKKVNVNKSYIEMKKYGFYNPNNYIFDTKLPKINITNNIDKYIVAGNNKENNIYIFIELDSISIKSIDNTYKNYNFIMSYNTYMENKKIIKKIQNNNSILITNTNYKKLKDISNDYYISKKKKIYCYNVSNKDFFNTCIKNKNNTISIKDSYSSNYYSIIKNNLIN